MLLNIPANTQLTILIGENMTILHHTWGYNIESLVVHTPVNVLWLYIERLGIHSPSYLGFLPACFPLVANLQCTCVQFFNPINPWIISIILHVHAPSASGWFDKWRVISNQWVIALLGVRQCRSYIILHNTLASNTLWQPKKQKYQYIPV